MIELFRVYTTVNQYHGCKAVQFCWFRDDPATGRPYADLIQNYQPEDKHRYYSESYIDELFTLDEANALKEYLDRDYGNEGVTTIKRVDLPVPGNTMGVSALPVGGGNDHYMLDKAEGYPLPFRARAYFDLRGCELADGSGRYPH
jgi:hypothetical protein